MNRFLTVSATALIPCILGAFLANQPLAAQSGPLRVLIPSGIELGMTREGLAEVTSGFRTLDPPLDFGPVKAAYAKSGATLLGHDATLYLQLDSSTGRLRQLLFERRDAGAKQPVVQKILSELRQRLGQPDELCLDGGADREKSLTSAIWRDDGLAVRVAALDHRSPGLAYFDPNSSSDPLQRSSERRRITRRSLPRRLIVRIHARDDPILARPLTCEPSKASRR